MPAARIGSATFCKWRSKFGDMDGWDEIGVVLADRIERGETSLYTMYLPPDAFR